MLLISNQEADRYIPSFTEGVEAMRLTDRTGERYGRLVVVERLPNKSATDTNARWRCRCDCGNETVSYGQDLGRGKVRSCGCLNAERIQSHGMSRLPVYAVWKQMIQRCENPKSQAWENYGGRGISVCESWHKFENFIADMGHPSPGKTLDRRDVNGNYCEANCWWRTSAQQANNTRRNRTIEYKGTKQTLAEWADTMGLEWNALRTRLDVLGWSVEKALTTPSTTAKRYEFQGDIKTLAEWAISLEIPLDLLRSRIGKLGWSVEQAFSTPVGPYVRKENPK
jgi:hypothetical protein